MIVLEEVLPELMSHRSEQSVSIYMPMDLDAVAAQKNPIRLKNLLKEAADLIESSARPSPLTVLEEQIARPDFWTERTPGLAMFHSPALTRVLRLSLAPEPLVVVADRFHVKPLIALLSEASRFHVLALSQASTRLLEVDRDALRRIGTTEIPASLHATMPADPGETQLQFHSGGRRTALYHGHGAGEHRRAEDVRRFLTAVDTGLANVRGSPLVLAGVSELTAAFRSLSSHPQIAGETIEGNVDALSDQELRVRAYPLAEPELRRAGSRALERFESLLGSDLTTIRIEEIVRAATAGRVDALFITKGEQLWGTYEAASVSIRLEETQTACNEDLLDLAAIGTFESGGSVFLLEADQMPIEGAVAAAILRYSTRA